MYPPRKHPPLTGGGGGFLAYYTFKVEFLEVS